MAASPLTRLRKLCLALPEAHEVHAWGEPTFRVNNKLFAMYASANSHHGGGHPAVLSDGRMLVVRGGAVGVLAPDSTFAALPPDEEIIFGGTLYIPSYGTANRLIRGILGPFRLKLANGVGIHGTPFKDSIGKAVTHGCIRLTDEDITWLNEHVPLGTRVIIH